MLRILGISGSLRGGWYNTALLRAGVGLMGDGAVLEPVGVFDAEGARVDDKVRAQLQDFLAGFARFVASGKADA